MRHLVLPSSLGTTAGLWDANASRWAAGLRPLPYTQQGRRSIAELGADLLALADEYRLERFSVCGLSMGGATAIWVAANAPERVERLVLACTSARFGEAESWLERAATVRARGLEGIADSVVARWFTSAMPAEVVARFRRVLVEMPADDYARCCEALADWDFRDRLSEIAVPTLVIAGAEDPATPFEHAELLAARIKDAKLVVLPGAAHLANVEQPEAFSRAVSDHLAPAAVA
jgi:3-oxoadipate enol-lactonase